MEPVHQADKASKPSSADVISSMPALRRDNKYLDSFDEIKCVGTSMLVEKLELSTLLTQLVFDDHGFAEGSWFDERDISRLLLDLKASNTNEVAYPSLLLLRAETFEDPQLFFSSCTQFSWFCTSFISLDLYRVTFESGNGGEFITQCPVLEILKISYDSSIGELKLADIAKLANLSTLSLPLSKLEDVTSTSSITSQIGSYFPNLQELYLDLRNYN
ncbi:F-box/FBD/LRR-repeat protein-like protein, partial [Tanacetum coccineum]